MEEDKMDIKTRTHRDTEEIQSEFASYSASRKEFLQITEEVQNFNTLRGGLPFPVVPELKRRPNWGSHFFDL